MDFIFNLIGTPSKDEISFVTDPRARLYLERFANRPPITLRENYPEGSDDALRILESLL